MATDLIARSLAAANRDGALPALRSIADLETRVVPAAFDSVEAGAGAAHGRYVADALATPALAAGHPLFCRADAAGRCFRLVPANGVIDFAHGGLTAAGGNMQPAVQATVSYANAVGIRTVVNGAGVLRFDMWCPIRTSPAFTGDADGIPLVVTAPVELDFGQATITLKNFDGGDRNVGQATGGYTDGAGFKPWLGGFIYLIGDAFDASLKVFDYFGLANVVVEGGFAGDFTTNAASNLSDKAFRLQDTWVRKVVFRNVELRNFGGEIYYHGGVGPGSGPDASNIQWLEDCHFHGTPQAAFNVNSRGRVTAINLEAGRAYAAAEVIGGPGADYFGCRFYDSANCYFQGGPDPDVQPGYHYAQPFRRPDAPPPAINFHDTHFDASGQITLTGWAQGKIVTVDSPVLISGIAPTDIDLDIVAWVDRASAYEAFALGGPADLTTPVPGSPEGVCYEMPSNIAVRVKCRRTKLAKANGRQFRPAVRLYAGLYDKDTIRIDVTGEASEAWDVLNTPPPGFAIPLIVSRISEESAGLPEGGVYRAVSADAAIRPAQASLTLDHQTPGTTHALTIDTTYGYAHGQELFLWNYNSASDPSRVLTFAKSADGVMLAADRTLRRRGEFLRLRYDTIIDRFVEVGVLDQGP